MKEKKEKKINNKTQQRWVSRRKPSCLPKSGTGRTLVVFYFFFFFFKELYWLSENFSCNWNLFFNFPINLKVGLRLVRKLAFFQRQPFFRPTFRWSESWSKIPTKFVLVGIFVEQFFGDPIISNSWSKSQFPTNHYKVPTTI